MQMLILTFEIEVNATQGRDLINGVDEGSYVLLEAEVRDIVDVAGIGDVTNDVEFVGGCGKYLIFYGK